MDSCIFSCAKNEDKYISEWCFYHLEIIGYDKIYIYDTSNEFSLKNHPINTDNRILVEHKPFEGEWTHYQMVLINEFIENYKNIHKWATIIDIDEFIVLKHYGNINNFLKERVLSGACAVNWVIFGNNFNYNYEHKPVIDRFTKCHNHIDRHIKSIVVMKDVNKYLDPHFCSLKNGNYYTEHNVIIPSSPFNDDNKSNDYIYINHYISKSNEELKNRFKEHPHRPLYKLNDYIGMYDYVHNENYINNFEAYNKFNEILYHEDLNKFDYRFYLVLYKDLIINGVINYELAYNHLNGLNEDYRISNYNFDFNFYRNNNYDLEHMNNTELWHHFKTNYKENRLTNYSFDYDFYRNEYDDLKHLSKKELWNHFSGDGIAENRKFNIIL